jgi:hypothetical protein
MTKIVAFFEGITRKEIPEENETIADDLCLDSIINHFPFNQVNIYIRSKEDCPFNLGNWIIAFIMEGFPVFILELPIEMSKDQVEKYIFPLKAMIKEGDFNA